MSIQLNAPQTFNGVTDTTVAAVDSKIDFMDGTAAATQCYGTGTGASFVPDRNLPAKNIFISLLTGVVSVNGIVFVDGSGNPKKISSSDLTTIITAMMVAQNAFDQALINIGLFSGIVL